MRLSWGAVYIGFWLYRSLYSILGETLVLRFTSIADTEAYQNVDLAQMASLVENFDVGLGFQMQAFATVLTRLVGGVFGVLSGGNVIFINLGFQTVAFAGLVVLLRAVEPSYRKVLLLLLMLPSFSFWSSTATKDALVVFLVAIIAAHVVAIYRNRDRLRWFHIVAAVLLFTFKPVYLIPILFIFVVTYFARVVRQKATMALLIFAGTMVMMYLFREQIDSFSRSVNLWTTSLEGRSTRPLYLVDTYDTFLKAPYGMLLAFVGPTFHEALSSPLQMATFIESSLILGILLFYLLRRLPELPVYTVVLALGTTFWVIFPNYPAGVFNPGTAIRYRTGYLVLILLVFSLVLSREFYVNWIRNGESRNTGPAPINQPSEGTEQPESSLKR